MHIITDFSSPNFSERPIGTRPQFIIMHYIEMPFMDALPQYLDPNVKLSPHYLIKKNGEIYNLVPDKHTAWHAGVSHWQNFSHLNDHSIGIEMDNLGNEPFTAKQMDACIELCHSLMQKHHIPRENILGHSDIAPDRKLDPGKFFDWKMMDKESIGMEFAKHRKMAENIYTYLNTPTSEKELSQIQQYLQNIGYHIDVTGQLDTQTNHVIRAFLTHFYPEVC